MNEAYGKDGIVTLIDGANGRVLDAGARPDDLAVSIISIGGYKTIQIIFSC